jgi:uncharacterized repeat protein (TIGR03803 family)
MVTVIFREPTLFQPYNLLGLFYNCYREAAQGACVEKFDLSRIICVVLVFCGATVIKSPAQAPIPTTLLSFDYTDGANPYYVSLIQGTNGNLYGTTGGGGTDHRGTAFEITPRGTLSTLYSFCAQPNCTDGYNPIAGLVQGTDGNFYGTTQGGGAQQYCLSAGCGTIFKITPHGGLTTLYTFCAQPNCTDGYNPIARLVQGADGNIYGTTNYGGVSSNCNGSCGTIFKITRAGSFTTLLSFDGTDGGNPSAGLVQGADGNFYGTTSAGGSNENCPSGGCGTVFKITPGASLTTLYSFCPQPGCNDGSNPVAGLVQGTDGNFYGTTETGGGNGSCGGGCGTVFRITPAGKLTTLHAFDSTDGSWPTAGLVKGTDGNLYGTTELGGASQSGGTAFRITPAGTLTTLYSFCLKSNCTDGRSPTGGLVQATNGKFYGTTQVGGIENVGTVFVLYIATH